MADTVRLVTVGNATVPVVPLDGLVDGGLVDGLVDVGLIDGLGGVGLADPGVTVSITGTEKLLPVLTVIVTVAL